jgi:lipoprotein-releasing system permease protein
MAVMLLAVAIVTGFQAEIRAKVVGFGSHLLVTDFNFQDPSKFNPISRNQTFYEEIAAMPEVRSIQVFGEKEGIIKTDEEVQGVIVKGVADDYDWDFFTQNMKEGRVINLSGENRNDSVVISQSIADKMLLELNETFYVFFIQNNRSRPRKFVVAGIYETGMAQFDDNVILGDLRHIRKIYGWEADEVGGMEIVLKDYRDLQRLGNLFSGKIPPQLNAMSITDRHPEIFGWLELQDMNVIIIITLMVLVSGINMIAALLILILEKTNMIGLLKAFGAQTASIRNIFLLNAAYLIGLGLLFGNLIGIGLGLLQQKFGFLTLPQESYYLSQVPVNFEISWIVLLNLGTLVLCLLMLQIPSFIVAKISPVRSIKFN